MNVNSENEALRLIEDVPIPAYMDDAYLMFDNSIVRQATNFEEAVNAGPFPVSATGLSYQQVNWLTKDGLLGASEKAGERGWRKFQFREIVYLRVLSELRSFGVGNDALHGLHQLFYRTPNAADEIILACLKASEATLLFYADGTGFVLSPERLFEAERTDDEAVKRSAIRVVVSRCVREALELIGLEPAETIHTLGKMIQLIPLSRKERAVVDALRNGDYTEITVTKRNGEPSVIYAENNRKEDVTNDVLVPMLMRSFANINVKRRDGKTVSVSVRDTIKL
ncbi:hypothetical protein DXC46_06815 [Eggerthella lenta]|uniref:hypothetical protein n=1 Tax=Eggerthella TaxID=84111 RepID=UPI000DF77ED8|nr:MULTISPECIES: hypothetical protein [Eggerthella]RGL81150.1 hypothetical protein DXC46_06815 [Eggerthella lenta]